MSQGEKGHGSQSTNQPDLDMPSHSKGQIRSIVHQHPCESQLNEPELHLTAAGHKEKSSKMNERPAAGSISATNNVWNRRPVSEAANKNSSFAAPQRLQGPQKNTTKLKTQDFRWKSLHWGQWTANIIVWSHQSHCERNRMARKSGRTACNNKAPTRTE